MQTFGLGQITSLIQEKNMCFLYDRVKKCNCQLKSLSEVALKNTSIVTNMQKVKTSGGKYFFTALYVLPL